MSSPDQAIKSQLKNIETRTGKSLNDFRKLILKSGLKKHGELRDLLISDFGMGFGDANTIIHLALQTDGTTAAEAKGLDATAVLDEIYSGPKESLRSIHDKLMTAINNFGAFEIAPKKGYVSLRRKKQFAMLGPATKTQVEVGINAKGLSHHGRHKEMPAASMCNYTIRLSTPEEADGEIISWLKAAYENAG